MSSLSNIQVNHVLLYVFVDRGLNSGLKGQRALALSGRFYRTLIIFERLIHVNSISFLALYNNYSVPCRELSSYNQGSLKEPVLLE